MNLLAAKLYDPGSAVSKATSSLLAMTAFDTTNLRLAVTVPAHGMVLFRLHCMLEGATTFPQILLGVLNGSTVVGRIAPLGAPDGTALATTFCTQEASFIATGLTPGATNFDAAYGVETVVAATNIKYGGPNNTSANDAFGGFAFEAWDPQPMPTNFTSLSIDSNGRVDVIKVNGTSQTARDLGASVLLSSGTGTGQLDFTSGVVKANLAQILGTALTETAGQIAAAFKQFFNIGSPASTMDALTLVATATAVTNRVTANTDQLAGQTVTAAAGVTFPASVASPTNITAGTITTVTNLTNAPTAGDFTAAMKTSLNAATPASVTGAVGSVVGLTASNLDATVSSRLASASYTAPDNTSVTAIKAKTDSLTYTVAGKVDANAKAVNDITVTGSGTPSDPWGP